MKLIYKILIPIIIILIAVFLAVDIFTTETFKSLLFDEKATNLISHTTEHNGILLSDIELNKGLSEATVAARMKLLHHEIADPSIFRIKVWDKNLKVIYSDLGEIIGSNQEVGMPQIRSLFLNNSGSGWRLITQFEDKSTEKGFGPYLDIQVPIKNTDGKVVYVVEIFSTTSAVLAALQSRVQEMAIFLGGIALLFSLILYIFIHLIIARPIRRLSKAMDIIGAGNLSYEINSKSKDEIGGLYKNFNAMRVQLKNYLEEVIQSKQSLEKTQGELEKEKKSVEEKIVERTNQLNSEKTKLSASISSLPTGFVMVDKSHNVLFINRKAQEILGLSKDRVKIFDDILCLFPKDSAIFKIHEDYHKEKILIEKKGEIVFGSKILKVSLLPIQKKIDEEVEVLGSILLIDDITEAKVLERSKNEFFSIASHELRTPLTAIRGNTSMILDYYAKDLVNSDLKTMITDTHSASVHLISIVNDFLDMSRLEQGKMEYKKEEVLLSEIVKKIMGELAVNASEKKISILSTIDEKMVVWADYGKVEQILLNLVGNALKFTEKGTITITAKDESDKVRIEVSDTGWGIPLANQSLLFRKFQQAGSNTVTRDTTQGTGLGLYISRLMAEGMGGGLALVKSTEGEGSVFCVTLPTSIKK